MSPQVVYDVTLPGGDLLVSDGIEFRDRAVLHCNLLVDYAGNKFEAYSTLSGNDTAIIIRKYSPADALIGEVTLHPPQGFKLDDFSLFPSDNNVLVLAVAHEAISDPNRRNIGYRDVWPGVFVAYPNGHLPVGGVTPLDTWTRDAPPNPVPTDIDYTRIDSIVQLNVERGVTLLANQFGSDGVRLGIEQKVMDGLRDVFTTNDSRAQAFRAAFSEFLHDNSGLYNRIKETVYEVLSTNGLIPPK